MNSKDLDRFALLIDKNIKLSEKIKKLEKRKDKFNEGLFSGLAIGIGLCLLVLVVDLQ